MTDPTAAIRGLLTALAAMGRTAEAGLVGAEFAARGWERVTEADVTRVAAMLAAPTSPSDGDLLSPNTAGATTDPDVQSLSADLHPALSGYAAFIEALPDGREIVEHADALTRCQTFDELAKRLCALFCDVLGYGREELELTARLGNLKSLQRVVVIARHREFSVTLVQTPSPMAYTNLYRPVFQVQPFGIVVAFSPRHGAVRFVYRRSGSATATALHQRTLVGWCPPQRSTDNLEDNLLCWSRRFDLMRPGFSDDTAALRDKVLRALDVGPGDIAAGWRSADFGADAAPPGPAWDDVPSHELRSFLQLDVAPDLRLHWGLEACFCDVFPIVCEEARRTVRYVGHHNVVVAVDQVDVDEHIAFGTTMAASFVLRMSFESLDDSSPAEVVELAASVPVPDRHGRFVLDGDIYVHRPDIAPHGGFVCRSVVGETGDDLEQYLALLESNDSGETPAEEDADATDDEELDGVPTIAGQPNQIGTVSLRALLESVVARKLFGISASLRQTNAEMLTCGNDLRWRFQRWTSASGVLDVSASHRLRGLLSPVQHDQAPQLLRAIGDLREPHTAPLPGWACPDLSSGLAAGSWWPVAGARLHPCGELAVPLAANATGRWQLAAPREDAFEINARLIGDAGGQPATWWIAPLLSRWASLPTGALQSPLDAARGAVEFGPGECLVTAPESSSGLVARMPALPRGTPKGRLRWLVRDLPSDGAAPEPALKVRCGDRVVPGDIWLEVPPQVWPSSRPRRPHRLRAALAQLVERPVPDALPWAIRVPPDVLGRVVATHCAKRFDQRGTRWSTRCSVLVEEPVSLGGIVILDDGRAVAIVSLAGREDLPWRRNGAPPAVVVSDPSMPASVESAGRSTDGSWRCGLTGDIVAVRSPAFAVWAPPPVAATATGPDAYAGRRLLDGGGMVERIAAPALTEEHRLWLCAAHPSKANALNAVELQWSAGLPPYWSAIAELLAAGSVAPPIPSARLELPGWSGRPEEDGTGMMDARRSNISHLRTYRKRRHNWQAKPHELLVVCCRCGALLGSHHETVVCVKCGEPAARRAVSGAASPSYSVRLPVRLFHPWRRHIAAGVLGLLDTELTDLLRSHSVGQLAAMVDTACSKPLRSLEMRHSRAESRSEASEIGLALQRLRRFVADANLYGEQLWLRRLPVAAPGLVPTGLPAGSPLLTASPLASAYHLVRLHLRNVEKLTPDTPLVLRTATLAALQRAVDLLFGLDADADPDACGSLASLGHRLWPATRQMGLRTSVPGLLVRWPGGPLRLDPRAASRQQDARQGFAEALAERVVASDRPESSRPTLPRSRATLMLITADGEVELPRCELAYRAPADRGWWQSRVALRRLIQCHARVLVAIAGYVDGRRGQVDSKVAPSVERDRCSMRSAVALLLQATTRQHGRPQILNDLLESRLPLTLPGESESAVQKLVARLERACPGQEGALSSGRARFASVLAGWWRGPADGEHPTGWRWTPNLEVLPSPWQRAAPPLHSVAWLAWPEVRAVREPLSWLANENAPLGEAMLALLGFESGQVTPVRLSQSTDEQQPPPVAVPAAWDTPAQVAADSSEAADDAATIPALTAELPATADGAANVVQSATQIAVWATSPAAWVAARKLCLPEEFSS